MALQQADNQGLRSKPVSLNSHPNSSFSIHLLTYISIMNSGSVCLWMTMAYAAQTFVFLNRIFNVLGQSQPEYLSGADIFAKGTSLPSSTTQGWLPTSINVEDHSIFSKCKGWGVRGRLDKGSFLKAQFGFLDRRKRRGIFILWVLLHGLSNN